MPHELDEIKEMLHHMDIMLHQILRNQYLSSIREKIILKKLYNPVPDETIEQLDNMIEQVKEIIP